ncbi:MAG TPA: ATP-binding protein [Bryobacteraceae bacterium]|nr:ATP-binding protein [Bryobacteraceae bacterium]
MKIWRFAAAVAFVVAVPAFYATLLPVNNTTVALTLVLAVLGVSARWGLAEATVASLAGVVSFNYFVLPPTGTLTISDPDNWVALLAFLVTAVTASQLSARARRRAAEAEGRRLEVERLYALVQGMMLSGGARKTIREFLGKVVQVFGCGAAAFYYRPTDEVFRSGSESQPISDHDLLTAAELDNPSMDEQRTKVIAPVRLGGRPFGSLALLGPLPSGEMVGAIVNLVAITIEKARALEEASHAEAARQSEALKSALLDSLAHDIKTPLTSIKAAATSLLADAGGGHRELLTIIDEEADRLNHLAAEVVAMARIEAGKLHLEKRPVPVAEIVSSALAGFAAQIQNRAVTVTVPADLPPADADPEFVENVVKQFIENALKYSPEGSPVTVSAERENEKIVIGVADRGPGIDEDERSRIFDKFFRGRRHRFDIKGTGMGLSIAKGIVEAHGGHIWVESEPGHGSVFYFSLPTAGEDRK